MSAIYLIVRYATMLLTAICFVDAVITFVDILNSSYRDGVDITASVIVILVCFAGAYGSFNERRDYLWTFVIFVIISIILAAVGPSKLIRNFAFRAWLAVLAIAQAELIKRGHGGRYFSNF